ncbi:hypothetical protein SprV_0401646600 [Sparganum proliferum]
MNIGTLVSPRWSVGSEDIETLAARIWRDEQYRRMIRVLLRDCHVRLRKYCQRTDQENTRRCESMGEIGTNPPLQRVTEQTVEQRMIRDAALENKFRSPPNPTSPRNDKLVHNLSSNELTRDQVQVLRHEGSFNAADAKPVNMITAVESIISQTEATKDTKSLIRHQVSSLLIAHRPREVLSKVERDTLRELKVQKELLIVPADKGRSTVVLGRTDYLQKAQELGCNNTDRQTQGIPRGSPITGFIAEAVLQRLESLVFQHHILMYWARYVDDTIDVIDWDRPMTFKKHFNAVFPGIQFTMEEKENYQLALLDVLVYRKDCGGLQTNVFRRATNTGHVLNFNSNHQISHKRSCVRTLYRRVEKRFSDPEDKIAELQYFRRVFKANGYPRNFVNRCIRKRPNRMGSKF